MLTVSLLLCALVALSRANDVDVVVEPTVKGVSDEVVEEVVAEVVEANSACPDGWSNYDHHCFMYVEDEMTWAEAEKNCLKQKGNLASIHSVEELEFVHSLVPENSTANGMWVGASDCHKEGTWLWSDNSNFEFTYWCPMKPNNLDGNQNCLQINVGACNCWNDLECSKTLASVCRTDE